MLFFACLLIGHTVFGMEEMVNAPDEIGRTPLFLIFHDRVVSSRDELINLSEEQLATLAAWRSSAKESDIKAKELAEMLLNAGARLDVTDTFGLTIFYYARIYNPKLTKTCQLILEWDPERSETESSDDSDDSDTGCIVL